MSRLHAEDRQDGGQPNDIAQIKGSIFNIQRFCTHDGPGIRTTVFVKGCPLYCQWCHNPEGLSRDREMSYDPARCIGCRACLEACEHGAHEFLPDGQHTRDATRCVSCGECVENCFAGALEAIGEEKTAQEVVDVVLRDKPFYDNSEGGATLSGGEPLFQPDFSAAILQLCRREEIGTAIETSSLVSWSVIERFMPLVDHWMCDVKHVDDDRHRELTGTANRQILDNVRRLCSEGASVMIRLPLIPTLNDDEESLRALGGFAGEVAPKDGLELMPYHRIGQGKYERVEREYNLKELPEADDDDLRRAATLLREGGAENVHCQRIPDL